MRILIDADSCPVVDETVRLARRYSVACLILCDTAHSIQRDGAQTLSCSTGADSVDFTLVNLAQPGDLVITQDYGLASMCLARKAFVLDQNGREYTLANIDGLLLSRHVARKIRSGGGRLKGPRKRSREQTLTFERALTAFLERHGASIP